MAGGSLHRAVARLRHPISVGALVIACALFAIGIAAVVLAGYATGNARLTLVADFPPVSMNTAVSLASAGLALLLLARGDPPRPVRWVAVALAVVPTFVGTITAAEYASGRSLGIDQIFTLAIPVAIAAGRPALPSAFAFIPLGLAFMTFDARMRRGWRIADLFAIAVGMIGVSALAGYLFGAAALYGAVAGTFPPTGVALQTALALIALSSGIIAARPETGLMGLVVRDSPGGRVVRVFLAGSLALALLSAGTLAAERLGLYDRATALALPAVITLFFAGALVIRQALRLDVAYENVRKAERERRRLFDAATDAIFVANLDARYIDVNDAACRLLGYTREELLGKTILDLIPPDEGPRLAAAREALLRGEEHLEEWKLRRKDGTVVPTELSAQILPDGRWQAIARDITARKEAEEALSREKVWLRAVIDQMPVGVLLMSADGRRLAENRALMTLASGGERRDDPFGNPTRYDLRLPNRDPVPLDDYPLVTILRGGADEVKNLEFLVRQPNDEFVPILVDAAAIRADDGTLLGGVTTVRDIRVQKELDRLREEWASIVAHDLRQPVATILISAESLPRMPAGPARDRIAERIRASAMRLSRMIQDLLDVSRLDAHRFEIERARTDLVPLLPEIVDRVSATPDGLDVVLDLPRSAPPVLGDAGRIEQIVGNLVSNAAKYGEPRAPIVVRLREAGDGIDVSVSNRGAGLKPEEIERIFERFQRSEGARRSGVEGLGLGLYITRGLVEAHGGTIRVESVPGETTTFTVHFPAMREAPAEPPSAPARSDVTPSPS